MGRPRPGLSTRSVNEAVVSGKHCIDWYPAQRRSSDGEIRKQIPTSWGRIQKDHHLTISGCRNGHGPGLNGEPYALKGARTVRGGEALMRFLLHSRWRTAFCIS